jgi:uncharacterized protein YfaP (DUF2135 family)
MARVSPWTLILGAVAGVAVACGSSTTSPSGSSTSVGSFIGGVSASGGTPVTAPQSGQPPAPTGGPSGSTSGGGTAIPSGASTTTVSGSGSFGSVDVSVGTSGSSNLAGASLGGARPAATTTASGFFQINLPSPVTSQAIVVTFAKSIPVTSFTLQFQLIAPNGAVGPIAAVPVTVRSVATGAVAVSLSWDQPTSLNLQVVEPSGNVISVLNPGPSSTGGTLDLSSNTGCKIDNIDTEDVGWPKGAPAAGTYIVRVDYAATCGVSGTDFVVTVNTNGTVTTFPGAFTSDEVDSGRGIGRTITTFTFGSPASAAKESRRLPGPVLGLRIPTPVPPTAAPAEGLAGRR